MTMGPPDTSAPAPVPVCDDVVDRAGVGARVLTLRGLVMRVISIASNLLLLALVTPEQLGLYAVVFGVSGLIALSSELGVGRALLRGAREPAREDYAALAGLQYAILGLLLVAGWLWHPLLLGFGALDERWFPWMLMLFAASLFVPIGTGARIRLERGLEYHKLAIVDVVNVVVQNVGLIVFALAGRFTIGTFVVFALMFVVVNTLLGIWSPGPLPSLRLRSLWPVARPSAGFMTASLVQIAKERATPLVVAHLFGLGIAGIWTFAARIGQLLNVTFDGFYRAAIPAAALLSGDRDRLQRLATGTLRGSLLMAAPVAAIIFVSLPVLGQVLPQWSDAVVLAQVSVLAAGFAGVAGASLEPVAVATRGALGAVVEQTATVFTGWAGFVLLALAGSQRLAWVVAPMYAVPVVLLLLVTPAAVRPSWHPDFREALLSLASALTAWALLTVAGAPALLVAVIASFAALFWIRPLRILDQLRPWRLAQR